MDRECMTYGSEECCVQHRSARKPGAVIAAYELSCHHTLSSIVGIKKRVKGCNLNMHHSDPALITERLYAVAQLLQSDTSLETTKCQAKPLRTLNITEARLEIVVIEHQVIRALVCSVLLRRSTAISRVSLDVSRPTDQRIAFCAVMEISSYYEEII
eukprot:gene10862-2937_t